MNSLTTFSSQEVVVQCGMRRKKSVVTEDIRYDPYSFLMGLSLAIIRSVCMDM